MTIESVLVLDPGERVGWVRADIVDGEIKQATLVQGVTPLKDMALTLGKRIDQYNTIAVESWRLYPGWEKKFTGNDFQPVQFIGMVRYLVWTNPPVRIKFIHPDKKGTGRKVMPDWMKARITESTEEHDKDALDLLSYYWWDKYV